MLSYFLSMLLINVCDFQKKYQIVIAVCCAATNIILKSPHHEKADSN